MFVEFPGASGNPVFVSADCIAQISVGSPEQVNDWMDRFYHPVYITYKPGYEGLIDTFQIDYDYLPEWLNEVRDAIAVGN